MIIHSIKDVCDETTGEYMPTDIFQIATRMYPTYAFSSSGYKMALSEHKKAYYHCRKIVPYWITFIDGKKR